MFQNWKYNELFEKQSKMVIVNRVRYLGFQQFKINIWTECWYFIS